MSNSVVLVTGGAGFLGSHLCARLLEKGFEVVCVDNLYTGSKSKIVDLFDNPNFEFIRHDVTFPLYLEVDYIFNMASAASPEKYQQDPVQTTKTNVHGAINVLGLAKRTGARILQASTSEVYGDPDCNPQHEEYWGNVNPIGIRSCYDEGKRCAETLFFDYHRQNGVDIRVARIFNTYGPLMSTTDGRVVSNLIVQALQNLPLTIYGDGSQTRSFCFVDDLIDGLMRFMFNESCGPGPLNLGNPIEYSMLDLAANIKAVTRSDSDMLFKTLPTDDPRQRCPNISKAQRLLGWRPLISLEDGLTKTAEYFRGIVVDSA